MRDGDVERKDHCQRIGERYPNGKNAYKKESRRSKGKTGNKSIPEDLREDFFESNLTISIYFIDYRELCDSKSLML